MVADLYHAIKLTTRIAILGFFIAASNVVGHAQSDPANTVFWKELQKLWEGRTASDHLQLLQFSQAVNQCL